MTSRSQSLAALDAVQMRYDELLHDDALAGEMRLQLVREAFALHLRTNTAYRRYAERLGAGDPTSIDPSRIPLLPSGLFKRRDLHLSSVDPSQIAKYCTSSGTSGAKSIVPRDDETLMRFLGSVTASLPPLFGLDRTGDLQAIVLGPTTEEAGDLWFAYVIACITVVMQTEYFESGGTFDVRSAVRRLRATAEAGQSFAVIGPPFRVLALCDEIARERRWPAPTPRSFVVTAGGWKNVPPRYDDRSAFRAVVAEALGLEVSQVRDSYNMVELNSVIHECPAHQKHVPPWVLAQCRDPGTNDVLPDGREGILAFLDPSATSYPGFVLSEDFGVLRTGPCTCGRSGQRLEVIRRVNRVEARGCALRMSAAPGARQGAGDERFFTSVFREPQDGGPAGRVETGRS